MAKKNASESEFAKESAAQTSAPSAAMIALFQAPGGLDLSRAERLNLPQLIKPGEVPIFTAEQPVMLTGEIVKVVESPASQVQGKCLWLKIPTAAGVEERLFPVTGVVRKALAPECKKDSKELEKSLEKHIGKTLVLKRLPNGTSKEYKRDMYMFEVFLLK